MTFDLVALPPPPEKLSDLLEAALADLDRVAADPSYRVDMGVWHAPRVYPNENGVDVTVCAVCLAGARLVGLDAPPEWTLSPSVPTFSGAWQRALVALDYLRKGLVLSAFNTFTGSWADVLTGRRLAPDVKFATYEDDPAAWRAWVNDTLARLRECGR